MKNLLFCVIFQLAFMPALAAARPLSFSLWGDQADKEIQLRFQPDSPRAARGLLPVHAQNPLESGNSGRGGGKPGLELRCFVSWDEYEPLSFAVYAGGNPWKDVRLELTGLENKDKDSISAENLDVRVVGYWPVTGDAGKDIYFHPRLLEKFSSVDIPANGFRQFWITIYCPKGKKGTYRGTVRIFSLDKLLGKVDITADIVPLKLEEPKINYGFYYNLDSRWKGFYPNNIAADFADMREHGLTSATVFFCPAVIGSSENMDFDFNAAPALFPVSLNEAMIAYDQSGLSGPLPFLGVWYGLLGEISLKTGLKENTAGFNELYVQAIRAIEKQRREKGWPRFLYSPEDEPAATPEKLKAAHTYLRLIRQAVSPPGVETYMTLMSGDRKPEKELAGLVDVPGFLVLPGQSGPQEAWIYNGGSEGRHPALDRFFFGIYAFFSNAQGIYQWVYQWPAELDLAPREEYKQGKSGWYYTYPSAGGSIPSPAWEAVREGVDDAKYLFTLTRLIDYCRDRARLRPAALAAQRDLEKLKNSVNFKKGNPQSAAHLLLGWAPEWKTEVFDQWRAVLARHIIILTELISENEQ